MSITIHRPVLTEEERARRMKRIEKAAIALVLDAEERKQERERIQNEQEKNIQAT